MASRWLMVCALAGCASGLQKFPAREPMARDDDMRPFAKEPAESFSPLYWDGIDNVVFRPLVRFFAFRPGGESVNVNALDEVPDSSWFQNRIGKRSLSPEALVRGPCEGPALDPTKKWKIIAGKPNGANPGLTIEDEDGRKLMLKLEGLIQPERAASADVIGSRIYWAAGFNTPCNNIVFFKRENLVLDPEAERTDFGLKKVKMTEADVDEVLTQGIKLPDGTYRAGASLFLPGKPLGPWHYHDTRKDDPNDVVDHQDRRELRGSRLLAAWLHHFDQRDQNSLDSWIEAPGGGGYLRHYLIDWGDCFGSLWKWDGLSRRIGRAYYFDVGYALEDLFSLGLPERPWEKAKLGPAGKIWGYYGTDGFVPEDYHVGYPNPAFNRMTERDAAWMARIMARFSDADLEALVDLVKIKNDVARVELLRILRVRRDLILRRYLGKLSALADPRVVEVNENEKESESEKQPVRGLGFVAKSGERPARAELCVEDVAAAAGIYPRAERRYAAVAWIDDKARVGRKLDVRAADRDAGVCVSLPDDAGDYLVVDLLSYAPVAQRLVPARVHLRRTSTGRFRVVGLERPGRAGAPGA